MRRRASGFCPVLCSWALLAPLLVVPGAAAGQQGGATLPIDIAASPRSLLALGHVKLRPDPVVPGIRARGVLSNPAAPDRQLKMEFLFLDDPETPWYLDSRMEAPDGRGGRKLLVRIATSDVQRDVAEALRSRCQAHVNDIYFATGSADMDSASAPALRRIAAALKSNPGWQLGLIGHTDSIGAAAANLELSRLRAEAVRAVLVREHGVAAPRLTADGRGELEPLEDNGTPAGRARNRRVDLKRNCD